ncbi:MAG: gamma-glutamyltransferase, partial [Chloroflexi bacterium]|nr:gamma-glutamyltransferase [Chloroflexota bacterium]
GPATGVRLGPGGSGDTIAACAVDREGNAACFIQSIYFDFGSAWVGGATGVLLQNRGAFFSLDPASPNRLEPRKRTFHTLMPSMLLENGRLVLVLGTMGGEGQPQTQAALITRVLDFGYDVQQAVEAPRWLWGRTWGDPSRTLKLEGRFPAETAAELRRRSHDVEMLAPWTGVMGHAQQIALDPDRGVLWGAADPRGDGSAAGW